PPKAGASSTPPSPGAPPTPANPGSAPVLIAALAAAACSNSTNPRTTSDGGATADTGSQSIPSPCAVRAISAGDSHTCALMAMPGMAAGTGRTCALTAAGGVRCWGNNGSGQLGDGTTARRTSPPTTDVLTGVRAIAAGLGHSCAVTDAGGVRCWGANDSGQLG